MNKFLLFFSVLIFLTSFDLSGQRYRRNSSNKSKAQVSFIIKSNQDIRPNNVYVTGDLAGFGPWDPKRVPLYHNPDGSWIGTIKLPLGTPIKIQYTQGSWNTAELNARNESIVHSIYLTRDTIIQHRIGNWGKGGIGNTPPAKTPKNIVKEYVPVKPVFSFVKQHNDFGGSGIAPRNITVYLPPSYEKETRKYYPVLYIHDGPQSYSTSLNISDHMRSTADYAKSLMQNGEIDEMIVVHINNKSDYQLQRFSTNIHPAYRKFVVQDLKPFIDHTYRTKTEARYNVNMGTGLCGLVSFLISYENSNDFGKVACLSPIFESERLYYSYAHQFKKDNSFKNLEIYFDNGISTSEKRLQPGLERMVSVLESQGYHPSFSIKSNSTERIKNVLRGFFAFENLRLRE